MRLKQIIKISILPALTLISGVLVFSLSGHSSFEENSVRLTPPPEQIEKFAFGYNESLADSLWLRVIQDLDTCEVAKDINDRGHCQKGWVYRMIDATTDLAPRFRIAYSVGGTALSILLEDKAGAELIFEKALDQFPREWPIAYKAAYHYIHESPNSQKAAALLIQAAQNGGPDWLYSLAAKMYSEVGRATLAKDILEQVLRDHPDTPSAGKIRMRLDEVNEILERDGRQKE